MTRRRWVCGKQIGKETDVNKFRVLFIYLLFFLFYEIVNSDGRAGAGRGHLILPPARIISGGPNSFPDPVCKTRNFWVSTTRIFRVNPGTRTRMGKIAIPTCNSNQLCVDRKQRILRISSKIKYHEFVKKLYSLLCID